MAIDTREPERLCETLRQARAAQGKGVEVLSFTDPDDDTNHAALSAWLRQVGTMPPGTWALVLDGVSALTRRGLRRRLAELQPVLAERDLALLLVSEGDHLPAAAAGRVRRLPFPLPDLDQRRARLDAALRAAGRTPGDAHLDRLAALSAGLGMREAEVALRQALARADRAQGGTPDEAAVEAGLRAAKMDLVRRTRALAMSEPRETEADLGGLDLLKEWAARRRRAFLPEARRFGLPEPRGVFLFGVQGCGKSLSAKVLASIFGLPLLRLDFVSLFGAEGGAEAGLDDVLAACDALAPVVLWIDEIDKLFRSLAGGDDPAALARVFAGFLTWMQERRAPVFVVATANEVERLPPELLRRGRFDDLFFVDLPGVLEREEILRIHLASRGRDPAGFDCTALSRRTGFFSGAELEQVVIGGLYRAFDAGRDLTQADLMAEAAESVPLYRTSEAQVKALREFARSRARPATSASDVLDLFRRAGA